MASSLRYLQDTGIALLNGKTSKNNSEVEPLIQNLAKEMSHQKCKHFFAYTDGSTDPKSKSNNSGCSVVISDTDHNLICSGGMVVRSDSNNFIPELAAASCVIKAPEK